jgi:hypothetical protein
MRREENKGKKIERQVRSRHGDFPRDVRFVRSEIMGPTVTHMQKGRKDIECELSPE